MPLRECTSDKCVCRGTVSRRTRTLPYAVACLAIASRPQLWPDRPEGLGAKRERPPPFWDASIGLALPCS